MYAHRLLFLSAIGALAWAQSTGGTSAGATAKSTSLNAASAGVTVTGSVKIDDGSALSGSAKILLECGGTTRTVANTNVVDDFGFVWSVATDQSPTGLNAAFNTFSSANGDAGTGTRSGPQTQANACDLRAELAGFSSSSVNLSNSLIFDGNIGVIWLHRIVSHDADALVSASTLSAPKNARKDFDKGMAFVREHKLKEAQEALTKAVAVYPQFAEAWLSLGRTQYRTGDRERAMQSLYRAVQIDPKIVGAWQTLGYIAVDNQKWGDAAQYLEKATHLNPLSSPVPWFYQAVADFHLGHFDEAERSIRAEMDFDPKTQHPRSGYLFGLILLARNDVSGAAAALRKYLSTSPDSRDVDSAKDLLAQAEAQSPVRKPVQTQAIAAK